MRVRILSLCLLLVIGCDEDPADSGRDSGIVYSTETPDELVASLQAMLNGRDHDAYASILADDFRFEFAPLDIAASGEPTGIWARPKELQSIQDMFTGQPSKDGEIVASIEMRFVARTADWTAAAEPELTGTLRGRYDIDMIVTMTNADIYNVDGEQDFYVVETEAGFQLAFWRDAGAGPDKADSMQSSWGSVKTLF